MPVSNKETENILRSILKKNGVKIKNAPRKNGQTGVDIQAQDKNKEYFIEVIGYKKSAPARSRDFYEVFFRAISRLNIPNTKHIVIALPAQFKGGLKQRVANYRVAWPRIGKAFPELEFWFIGTEKKTYEKMRWSELD